MRRNKMKQVKALPFSLAAGKISLGRRANGLDQLFSGGKEPPAKTYHREPVQGVNAVPFGDARNLTLSWPR
jgi:hypothetical protein